MNIKMTPREALKIQAEHVAWYGKHRADLAQVVAAMTNISGLDLDAELSIIEINRRIPRGGDIEHLCGISQD